MRFSLFIMLLSFSIQSYSDQITYRTDLNPARYDTTLKKQIQSELKINIDDKDNSMYFYSSEEKGMFGFMLTSEQTRELVNSIEKYITWNKRATTEKIKLEKQISIITSQLTYWKTGNANWTYGDNTNIKSVFLSLKDQGHQYVLVFSQTRSVKDPSVTHNPESLYFSYNEAQKLLSVFSDRAIAEFLEASRKQKAIESNFK